MMAVLKNLFRFRLPQNISDVISSKPLPRPGDAAQKFLCLLGVILFVVLILQTVVTHPALFLMILFTAIVQERIPATSVMLTITDQLMQMFISDRLLFTLFLIDEILDLLFI